MPCVTFAALRREGFSKHYRFARYPGVVELLITGAERLVALGAQCFGAEWCADSSLVVDQFTIRSELRVAHAALIGGLRCLYLFNVLCSAGWARHVGWVFAGGSVVHVSSAGRVQLRFSLSFWLFWTPPWPPLLALDGQPAGLTMAGHPPCLRLYASLAGCQ